MTGFQFKKRFILVERHELEKKRKEKKKERFILSLLDLQYVGEWRRER